MARVTSEDVKQIISTTLNVMPFIETASVLITDRLTGKGLSADVLREIERWLTAHLISLYSNVVKRQKIGDAEEEYAIPTDAIGLKSTRYGQQVLALDSSGTLANLGKRKAIFQAIDFSTNEDE